MIETNDNIWHVYPVGDTEEHEMSQNCKCKPVAKEEGDGLIIVHNSFDGREGVEWANEIICPTP